MRKIFLFCIAFFAFFAISCTEKKDITKKEAQMVLNDFFAKNCILLLMDESEVFRLDAQKSPLHVKKGIKKYEFFAKLGYYRSYTNDKSPNGNQIETSLKTYKLTKEGQKHFIVKKQRLSMEKGFCAGYYEASKIKKITKIDKIFNREALRVEFVCKASNKYDFAKSAYFLEIFQDFDSFASSIQKATLIFTEDGWKVKEE